MIGALRQQPVDKGIIDAVGGKHRFGDALGRVLVEVEAGGAEREIEIGHDRVEDLVARYRKGNVVGHSGGADAAFSPDHGDDPADGLGVGCGKQATDRTHDLKSTDRRDQIIADAAPHQLTIEPYIVHAPDDDNPRGGIADRGELIETGEDILVAAFGFEDDDVRRRRVLIGLDCRDQPAHLDAQMRLGHAPVLAGGLDRGGGLDGFAESLHRNPRRRRDTFLAAGDIGGRAFEQNGFAGRTHSYARIICRGR